MLSDLSGPTNGFGLRFLEQLNTENSNKNVVFSPLSVILAYGMLLEGATGRTGEQIKEVLQLSSIGNQNSEVSQTAKKLYNKYKSIAEGSSDRNFSLILNNLIMVHKNYTLKEAFVQSLLKNYFAKVTNEDFQKGAEVMNNVNLWVSKQTFGKIDKILTEPTNPDMICIIINTVYFKGKWRKSFKSSLTFDETFTNSDGTKSKIEMMSLCGKKCEYLHNPVARFKVIELRYIGKVSMIFILPTESNTLPNLLPTLNSIGLETLLNSMSRTKLRAVKIPKFKLEDTHKLHEILPRMGMDLPFSGRAEFKNITEESDLFVSESIQKAFIEVNEEGTVAAAVTKISCAMGGMRTSRAKEDFILDRPFIFMIRDKRTGINLFIGQMNQMPDLN
ncbi:intracellular coagulation inhibitor 2-like [Panonychus citri]|uniref:intracellular coagulation inhibitor 2-like n=1 Tax=Panonychus citri TaxID=50023 RepID=UPI002307116D|nr:intracellular coagulation inhibitor 2-like [Panonychus citri]